MKKRVFSFFLALFICLSVILGTGVITARAFSDISDSTVSEAAEVLSGLGIVSGYPDGSFLPNATLTRSEFCVLAVQAGGFADQLKGSAYRTLFTDVPATHWSASYVNLALDQSLISGYGNGEFGPDDTISAGQAVTVILRLLGYSTADIGPFWPEDYMQKAADIGLTEGLSLSSSNALTRGQSAVLLYNMLGCQSRDGSDYLNNLAAGTVSGAVILDTDAENDSGETGLLQVYTPSSGVITYEQSKAVSSALEYRRGTLLLDASGSAAGFVPDSNTYRVLTPSTVTASGITSSGTTYAIPSSAVLVLDEDVTTYGNGWYSLEGCTQVTIFYSSGGTVNLVVASESTAYEGVTLTGYYEDVSPNLSNPTTITVLGLELDVNTAALDTLSQFVLGDRLTVELNGSGDVISARTPTTADTSAMTGVVTKVSGSDYTVTLFSGLTVSGTKSSSGTVAAGALVKVTSSGIGKISLSTLSDSTISGALNVAAKTLGSIPLSDSVTIYDRVGDSTVVAVSLSDIPISTVPAASISYAATNSSVEISVLVLKDITGKSYSYGILHLGKESVTGDEYSNRTVSVENADGTGKAYVTGFSFTDGAVGGIAISDAGKTTALTLLTKKSNISRSSISSDDYVVLDGVQVPISDDVQVYNTDNSRWITLSAAKSYASSFTVYYSGTIGTDAVVRVVMTG